MRRKMLRESIAERLWKKFEKLEKEWLEHLRNVEMRKQKEMEDKEALALEGLRL